jgi:hypothetical protein
MDSDAIRGNIDEAVQNAVVWILEIDVSPYILESQ